MLSDPVAEAFGLIHRHPSGENLWYEPGTTRTSEFNLNGRHVDVVGSANNKAKMYLGQPTIGLRRYGWETSTEGSLRRKKKKKNKVEEFPLANPASLGSLSSN